MQTCFASWFARLAALAWLVIAAPGSCAGAEWLVLLVDRSQSIDDRELALQRSAYVRLLSDEAVAEALADTQVAIVEFDTRAELIADWADAASAAKRYQETPLPGLRRQTGIGAAIAMALNLLAGKQGRRVIDISGDGKENVDTILLDRARAAADQDAVEINGLAILNDDVPEMDVYYRRWVANGFVMPVHETDDFYTALRMKLLLEIAGLDGAPFGTL